MTPLGRRPFLAGQRDCDRFSRIVICRRHNQFCELSGYRGDVSIFQVRLDNGFVMKAAATNTTRLIERPISLDDQVWLAWGPGAGVVLTR